MNAEQEEQLREAVAAALGLDPGDIDDTTGPANTENWSSLAHLAVIASVEEAFGVQFTMDDMEGIKSVGDLKALINSYH